MVWGGWNCDTTTLLQLPCCGDSIQLQEKRQGIQFQTDPDTATTMPSKDVTVSVILHHEMDGLSKDYCLADGRIDSQAARQQLLNS